MSSGRTVTTNNTVHSSPITGPLGRGTGSGQGPKVAHAHNRRGSLYQNVLGGASASAVDRLANSGAGGAAGAASQTSPSAGPAAARRSTTMAAADLPLIFSPSKATTALSAASSGASRLSNNGSAASAGGAATPARSIRHSRSLGRGSPAPGSAARALSSAGPHSAVAAEAQGLSAVLKDMEDDAEIMRTPAGRGSVNGVPTPKGQGGGDLAGFERNQVRNLNAQLCLGNARAAEVVEGHWCSFVLSSNCSI